MHRFLQTHPFDLYELALFQLVVKHGSFTRAAQLAGLTQSAITRQVQGIEKSLGVPLLERTTRKVRLTPAGEFLLREATRLLGDVDRSLVHLAQEFAGARKEIRVAVSHSIGLAYLPGFFHANLRKSPELGYRVTHQPSSQILDSLESNEQDLGVLGQPRRLPKTLRVTHHFADNFTCIAPADLAATTAKIPTAKRVTWLLKQPWLLLNDTSNTGQQLRAWMNRQGLRVDPTMQLDNFDLIINLVSLGLGVSLVPIRALALYNRNRRITRVHLPSRFTRELAVVIRNHPHPPPHLQQFVANILF